MAKSQQARLTDAIAAYYATLKEFEFQQALHEGAVSVAFQTLLAEAGRPHKWTLIPQLSDKAAGGGGAGGKGIRPDGTLKDWMNLVRGHWEAKDTSDDLDAEIAKKIKKGYPLGNIIFEDTRRAVLFQNRQETMRIDLRDPAQVERLLKQFFDHVEPQIESFEKAIDEFKDRVPELAKALLDKITEAHQTNGKFKEAFARFFELCQTSLNPTITRQAVDDMLVQHLLTERLIREIFDNPEFVRRNVIAAEIEKVILALTSKSFDRNVFLKSLDRFYVAIEHAARTITDFSDKQHFLNTVYERFFQGYSVKLADTMGIVYTPQPIVDFMCASVAEVLEREFGKTLGSKDVYILDPCTGTGNFVVNLIRRIPKRDLPRVYREQLFANEMMLLPYYIAALNIEHAYYEQTGEYEPFEGLCFVDTLDLAEERQAQLGFMTAGNAERVERQKRTPITVIIGNPPYNADQQSDNDNNRNRGYPVVDLRVRETYAALSQATNKNKLSDPYVRFLRWASDRLGDRDGVIAYITNNNFVDTKPFDGLRRTLAGEFQKIYHVDLHGDVRKNPKLSGTTHNVFGIQTGVGVTLFVRSRVAVAKSISYFRVPENARREEKLKVLEAAGSITGLELYLLTPAPSGSWLATADSAVYDTWLTIASKEAKAGSSHAAKAIFRTHGPGLQTNRDEWVYDFAREPLLRRMTDMADVYNADLDKWRRAGRPADVDFFVTGDERRIKWSSRLKETFVREQYASVSTDKVRCGLYRPYVKKTVLFDDLLNHRPGLTPYFFPGAGQDGENVGLIATSHSQIDFSCVVANVLPDVHIGARPGQCLPFYVYERDGTNRRENVTDWALGQFRTHYKDDAISKWDIFHYVYGVLHHPGYRAKFADNLKRELPRIPFAPDFAAFRDAGRALAQLHLDYEKLDEWPLTWEEAPGVPLSYRVEKMKLAKDKASLRVNESLALAGIPREAFEYRLGNRSALEWVIDQYQVHTDKRSGITSDPNRADDEPYIVRLVGQVVRVSVETVRIVNALPDRFGDEAAEG